MSFDFFNQNAVQPGGGPELGPNGEESEYAVPSSARVPPERFQILGKNTMGAHNRESDLVLAYPPP